MLKISIPTPCHEDWNKMTPDKTGRHCNSCAKSVVDFTAMSDYEVQNYFLNKKEQACGRFKKSQLQQIVIELPENIFRIQMPSWKKFLAACLIVFSTTLFSCETKLQGDMMIEPVKIDTITHHEENDYVGGLMITYDSIPVTDTPVTTENTITTISIDSFETGIMMIPPDSVSGVQPIDTLPAPILSNETIFMGDTVLIALPIKKLTLNPVIAPGKTKNPPKADSINCNTIKNYY